MLTVECCCDSPGFCAKTEEWLGWAGLLLTFAGLRVNAYQGTPPTVYTLLFPPKSLVLRPYPLLQGTTGQGVLFCDKITLENMGLVRGS